MSVFVDTSALLAVLNAADRNHNAARTAWEDLIQRNEHLIVTNYIVVETCALIQHRHGLHAVQQVQQAVMPLLQIHWVDESIHSAAMATLLAANRRQLSLVDCVSFVVMRQLGLDTVFAFDNHFAEQHFTLIP